VPFDRIDLSIWKELTREGRISEAICRTGLASLPQAVVADSVRRRTTKFSASYFHGTAAPPAHFGTTVIVLATFDRRIREGCCRLPR
jgi:hypothetical protein